MKNAKVLVLGATGAMGQYLVPRLGGMEYEVDAVALDKAESSLPNVRYFQADLRNPAVFRSFLERGYKGIVDFLIYPSADLPCYLPQALGATEHYIYLSSYRIYADCEHPVRETSPRLIDASDDVLLRNSDDYCIFKARGENIVRGFSSRRNWTIIRPAITYSLMRYQLVTLEAHDTVGRAFTSRRAGLPESARNVQATMSWAGDVAAMIAGLLFNDRALGETYSVTTAEHHTWGEIADYYRELCGLESVWVDQEDYLRILQPERNLRGCRWQLEYDRLFNRIMDNAKVLAATGMKQGELMPLYEGLKLEISRCSRNFPWRPNPAMDAYLAEMKS